jgi:rod shape-determining protein MreC
MRHRLKLLAYGGFGFALLLLVLLLGNPASVRRSQEALLSVLTPFLRSGSALERKFTAFREGLKTLEALENECRSLRTINRELSATNQIFRGLEAENNRLRNALGYRERAIFQLMPARIVGRDVSTWFSQVVIDRGSEDGLKRDMPVLTEDGLVGKTTVVSEHSAVVVLMSDENCKVATMVEGSREQGIVRGERASTGTMPAASLFFLSKQAALKPGQRVMTSGVGGVFPAGILVGVVQEFRVRELDGYATLVPAVDLTTLQDVFVVISQQK